jgi:hypothetical protein
VVIDNRIRGRARAALAVATRDTGIPGNSQFVSNDLEGFQPSPASVSVQDAGTGTVIVKLGGKDK